MPTSTDEVLMVKSIVDRHIDHKRSNDLFSELWEKVGSKSTNESVQLSFLMLRTIFSNGLSEKEKLESISKIFCSYKQKDLTKLWQFLLNVVVVVHFAVVGFNLTALFLIPFLCPWYIAFPLLTYLINLIFTSERCLLTKLENKIRSKLGLEQIKGFLGYYINRFMYPPPDMPGGI